MAFRDLMDQLGKADEWEGCNTSILDEMKGYSIYYVGKLHTHVRTHTYIHTRYTQNAPNQHEAITFYMGEVL